MFHFFRKSLAYLLSFTGAMVLLVFLSVFHAKRSFDFSLDAECNMLIVGNSNPECALNDSILEGVINLSQSGSGYFYNYLKAREFLNRNKHIDTLIVGYTYNDLFIGRSRWFTDKNYIRFKIRDHLFLFTSDDYWALFKESPFYTLIYTPGAIISSFQNFLFSSQPNLGEHLSLKKQQTEDEIVRAVAKLEPLKYEYSEIEIEYLKRIYELCEENGVQMLLLSVPLHASLRELEQTARKENCAFVKNNMPEAIFLNHASIPLPEDCFADLFHLNDRGAYEYSTILKKGGLTWGAEPCL